MTKTISPLRYPGGKSQFYKHILNIIEQNNLLNCTYVEPFAGGAGVALRLLLEKKVSKIIINDYDRSIYAFWHSILKHTDWFCQKINDTQITIEEYKIQKEIQKNKQNIDLKELGFSTFFLNRTNRSGIIKAGPIGGFDQSGEWKIDCRFNKKALIEKIKLIASMSKNILIKNQDTLKLIKNLNIKVNEKYFFFFDPPYYNKGKELYANFYSHNDHQNLSDIINKKLTNNHWIVTYDTSDMILEIYKKNSYVEFSLNYSVAKKRKATEYMFYNNLKIGKDISLFLKKS